MSTAQRESAPRLLVVAHNFPPHLGGLEIVAQSEARGMARDGWGVTVLTSAADNGEFLLHGTSVDEDITVVRKRAWDRLEDRGVPFPVFGPTFLVNAWSLVKRSDLVHIHDTLYISSWVAAVACWMLRKPYVVTKHVVLVPHPSKLVRMTQLVVHQFVGRHLLNRAEAVFAINPSLESDLLHLQHEIKPKTRVLLNGIDTERFHPAADADEVRAIRERFGLPSDRLLVLFAGRLVPKKRLSVLTACRSADYQVVIAGGDAQTEDERASDTIFLGRLDQNQMAEIYRAADIFVCPSMSEFLPLTVLEAAASGLTVIVEDDPFIGSSVIGEHLIRLTDIGTDLEAILDGIASDTTTARPVNTEAARVVHDYFSLATHLQTLRSVYDQVLLERGVLSHAV